MPKVSQAHLDARRQQILNAARIRFANHGFARTSMTDLVDASGLSNGAIYRYFKSKNEIISAICDESSQTLPTELSADSIRDFLNDIRTLARDQDHARLVAQIYAEAVVSPSLAATVQSQLHELRTTIAIALPIRDQATADQTAAAFVALCHGYTQQLAVRGDLDPEPYVTALIALVEAASDS